MSKHILANILSATLELAGCSSSPPAPPPPPAETSVEVHAPGVDVNVGKDGVDVKAPGANVEVDRKP